MELSEIYEEYFKKTYNHVYFHVLSKEITEDLVSEIFLKVVKNYDKFDSRKSSFNTWIYTITNHTLIDFYRQKQRKDTVSLDTEDAPDLYDEADITTELIQSEDRKALHRALGLLDSRTREIISLKYNGEMSIHEIAEFLHMNESTVSTVHVRGLKKLRKILKEDFFSV